jgi:hypothetical protein
MGYGGLRRERDKGIKEWKNRDDQIVEREEGEEVEGGGMKRKE